jgi:hypothetical protein
MRSSIRLHEIEQWGTTSSSATTATTQQRYICTTSVKIYSHKEIHHWLRTYQWNTTIKTQYNTRIINCKCNLEIDSSTHIMLQCISSTARRSCGDCSATSKTGPLAHKELEEMFLARLTDYCGWVISARFSIRSWNLNSDLFLLQRSSATVMILQCSVYY